MNCAFLLAVASVLMLAAGPRVEEPLASIYGAVKVSEPKTLIVETADSNTIEFYCTKRTRYFEGNKRISQAQLKPGDLVRVESRTNLLGEPEAVNVYREMDKHGERR